MPPIIKLSDKDPVAVGKKRLVFRHPYNPEWLIKVYRKSSAPQNCHNLKALLQAIYLRHCYVSGYTREFREYITSRYYNDCPLINHLQSIIGLVDTDIGLGLIVEALTDKEGKLAPTLRQLIKNKKLSPKRKESLTRLFESILASDLIVGDLNVKNIVLAYSPSQGERFFLIDGLGDKTLIPLHRWFKCVRRRYNKKRIAKITRIVENTIQNNN